MLIHKCWNVRPEPYFAGKFPVKNAGKAPQYISSRQNDGEFLLSSAKSVDSGLVGFTVLADANGNLTGGVKGVGAKLNPAATTPDWTQKKFQQDIQRSAGNVVVEYTAAGDNVAKEYALVADYNFLINDSHYGNSDMLGKQIGGKIGVIEDPFGKNGGPKYLGATTPIVGGAVEHLSLAMDGKLYADVLMDEPTATGSQTSKALFVWDAASLVQAALDADSRGQKVTTPIDRVTNAASQVVNATPMRINGSSANVSDNFGWTYGIGTYTVPGRGNHLKQTVNTYPVASQSVPVNVYTQWLAITDQDYANQIAAGDSATWSAAKRFGLTMIYDGWNFFTAGFVGRQADRYQATINGGLTDSNYMTATGVDIVTSIASIALSAGVAGRVGATVPGASLGRIWGSTVGAGAAAGATFTLTQKTGELGSYLLTGYDPTSGKIINTDAYWRGAVTELATSTVLGAGLGAVGLILSGTPRGNLKVMSNSPNELNPTQFKVSTATVSADVNNLRGSLADSTGGTILADAGGTLSTSVGSTLNLPAAASMTVEQATQWLIAQGKQIPNLINKNLSLREQAFQAVELKNGFELASRNAMQNASAAAQLNLTRPPLTFQEMQRLNEGKYAGDALYKKIISDATEEASVLRPVTAQNGCFVAGTLVHTKEGLKPIETIKVGDWVLSQPEQKGESAYKQVLKTFMFEDKEIILVRFYKRNENAYQIGVTGNHPFWVKGVGWTRADQLGTGSIIELQDGSEALTLCATPLYRTLDSGVGWAIAAWGVEANDGSGNRVVIHSKSISVGDEDVFNWGVLHDENNNPYFKAQVFNLEVDGFHTYYVGELGAWVHNTNCGDIGVSLIEASVGVRPSPNTRVYFDRAGDLLNLPGTNKGVIFVVESSAGKSPAALAFERATMGAQETQAGEAVAWSLRYDNTITNGFNYIKLGDGRVHLPDGTWTTTFIDAKSGEGLGQLYNPYFGASVRAKSLGNFERLAKALNDNPGYSQIVEFETQAAFAEAKRFFTEEVATQGWYTQNIMLRIRGQGTVTVFSKDAAGQVVSREITPTFLKAADAPNPLTDVANEFIKNEKQKLVVIAEGTSLGQGSLTPTQLDSVLPAAKQYWLTAGASAAVLDATQITIGDLPSGVAGQIQGNQITLSANGAGWGWFVDSTPALSEEFTLQANATLQANVDTAASGKLDLLTVMIHELGHRLGLVHNSNGAMEGIVQAGERQLPSVAEVALVQGIHQAISAKPLGGQLFQTRVTQFAIAANATLTNGSLNAADGWSTQGSVEFGNQGSGIGNQGVATLREVSNTQTRLSQVFMLGANDRYLSFTLSGSALDAPHPLTNPPLEGAGANVPPPSRHKYLHKSAEEFHGGYF